MFRFISNAPNSREIGALSAKVWLFFGFLGCSSADESLQPWPVGPRLDNGASTDPEPSVPESSGTNKEEAPAETQGEDDTSSTGSAPDQTTQPDSSTSVGSDSSTTEQTDSLPDTTSEPEQDGSEKGTPDPDACVQKICAELNPLGQGISDPREVGQYIFYFKAEDWARRLARVEIMEGFVAGLTSIVVKSDGGDTHGDVIAELGWTKRSSDLLEWTGDDFPTPVNIEDESWLWVEVTPAQGVFSSLASEGEEVPVWERNGPDRAWRKGSAPVMFRAYCCEETL